MSGAQVATLTPDLARDHAAFLGLGGVGVHVGHGVELRLPRVAVLREAGQPLSRVAGAGLKRGRFFISQVRLRGPSFSAGAKLISDLWCQFGFVMMTKSFETSQK